VQKIGKAWSFEQERYEHMKPHELKTLQTLSAHEPLMEPVFGCICSALMEDLRTRRWCGHVVCKFITQWNGGLPDAKNWDDALVLSI